MKLGKMLLTVPLVLALAGCNGSVKSIKSLTLEEVSGTRLANMTQNEKDGVLFKYITNSVVVDNANLISISETDFESVEKLLTGIHKTLKGYDAKDIDGLPYISDNLANYILFEFTKTPYEWKHVSTTPVGFDASTRMYFIDVNYETTDSLKYVIPSSTIADGMVGGDIVKEKRYNDYMAYLAYAAKGDSANATPMYNLFKQQWGSIDNILEEQDTRTLLERVQAKPTKQLGSVTYTGVIQDPTMTQPAKMTMRYILGYKYNLGEETTLSVSKAYLKDYELIGQDKYTEQEDLLTTSSGESLSVLEPYIKRTLTSYEKAVTEKNHRGLFSLFENYQMFDKYYTSLDKYTYSWSSNFTYKILDKQGTDLKVLVEREKQYRGKHTNMSMPTYKETVLYTMVMSSDDKLKIKNSYLLKSQLVGEPNTVIRNISGVSELMNYSGTNLSEENKEKIKETVKRFLQLVYENDTSSSDFTDVVDIGVSQNTLLRIHDNIKSITGAKKKVNYMTWDTKSNVYASVVLREIFLKAENNIDTESKLELVNRNGEWYVINYVRTLSVRTKAGEVTNTKNILSENTPKGSVDRKEEKEEPKKEVESVPSNEPEEEEPEDNLPVIPNVDDEVEDSEEQNIPINKPSSAESNQEEQDNEDDEEDYSFD